jgi:hypothetical protein
MEPPERSILYEVLVDCESDGVENKGQKFAVSGCFLFGLGVQLNRRGSRERKHLVSFREATTMIARSLHQSSVRAAHETRILRTTETASASKDPRKSQSGNQPHREPQKHPKT